MVPGFALCEALIAAVMRRMGRDGIRRMGDLETLRTGFEWVAENEDDVAIRRKGKKKTRRLRHDRR
jgi:hypothetical protein